MKKFLAILMVFVFMFTYASACGCCETYCPSPSIYNLYRCSAPIDFKLMDDPGGDLLCLVEESRIGYDISQHFIGGEWDYVDLLYISFMIPLEYVSWTFPCMFNPDEETVGIILIDENFEVVGYMLGVIESDYSVTFNFEELWPGYYHMLVFAGLTAPEEELTNP